MPIGSMLDPSSLFVLVKFVPGWAEENLEVGRPRDVCPFLLFRWEQDTCVRPANILLCILVRCNNSSGRAVYLPLFLSDDCCFFQVIVVALLP